MYICSLSLSLKGTLPEKNSKIDGADFHHLDTYQAFFLELLWKHLENDP